MEQSKGHLQGQNCVPEIHMLSPRVTVFADGPGAGEEINAVVKVGPDPTGLVCL